MSGRLSFGEGGVDEDRIGDRVVDEGVEEEGERGR